MKIGIGFDVHTLQKGEKLILAGLDIDYKLGLSGHSDGDVLTHALIDAILGAMGQGDIGQHFPDTDDKYKNICSLSLLENVKTLMKKSGYKLNNADLILMAEKPKISPYAEKIINNLSEKLKVKKEKINFKATTLESMGFIGREEGMGAQAVVSLIESVSKNY